MKKVLGVLLVVFFTASSCFAAWDKTKPLDSGKLKDFPAQCRANWEAIEAGTDPALQVTNAKVSNSAGITENKLSFDGTSGHDHTGGGSGKKIPLATGVTGTLPIANGGTGLTSAGGTANRAVVTSDGSFFSMAQIGLTNMVTGTLPVGNGGTGLTSAGGTANRVLKTTDGSTFSMAQVALSTDVTGTLPTVNIETVTTPTASKIPKLDANGYITPFLKIYDSGWNALTPSGSVTLTHNLGTTKVIFYIYLSTASDGSAAFAVGPQLTRANTDGVNVTLLSTTQIRITTKEGYAYYDASATHHNSSGTFYVKIIMLALE